jgi:hypothetical protein
VSRNEDPHSFNCIAAFSHKMKFQLIILVASPAREQTGLAFRAANERRAEKSPRAGLKATHLLERPAKVRPEGPRNTDWKCDAHAAVERRQAAFSSLFLAGGGQGPFQTTGAQQAPVAAAALLWCSRAYTHQQFACTRVVIQESPAQGHLHSAAG